MLAEICGPGCEMQKINLESDRPEPLKTRFQSDKSHYYHRN